MGKRIVLVVTLAITFWCEVVPGALAQDTQVKPKHLWGEVHLTFLKITQVDLDENLKTGIIKGHFVSPPTKHFIPLDYLTLDDTTFKITSPETDSAWTEIIRVKGEKTEYLTPTAFQKEWKDSQGIGWQVNYFEGDEHPVLYLIKNAELVLPDEFASKKYWDGLRLSIIRIVSLNIDDKNQRLRTLTRLAKEGMTADLLEFRYTMFPNAVARDDKTNEKIVRTDMGKTCICNKWLATADSNNRIITMRRLEIKAHLNICKPIDVVLEVAKL